MTRPTLAQMRDTDAMHIAACGLSFPALCDVIEAHIEARPDIDPARLHDLSNKCARRADKVERERR